MEMSKYNDKKCQCQDPENDAQGKKCPKMTQNVNAKHPKMMPKTKNVKK